MKRVNLYSFGGPSALVHEDAAKPEPGPGQVLIKVLAAGVNYADLMRRAGTYIESTPLPCVLGIEAAGTIEAIGADVETLSVGMPVLAVTTQGGAYAQYVLASPDQIVPLPAGSDLAQSTALVVQGLTAHLILTEVAPVKSGDTVLVHAAAGGVGSLAVQIAKSRGAGTVIATASSDDKLDTALALGADIAINYTREDWTDKLLKATGGQKADIVLESAGGEIFARSLMVLAPFGRLVTFGAAGGERPVLEFMHLLAANQTVSGFYLAGFFNRSNLIQQGLATLFDDWSSGRLKVLDVTRFPLEAAAAAHSCIHERRSIGKVVLEPWT